MTEHYSSPVGILKITSDGSAVKNIEITEVAGENRGDAVTAEAVKQLREYFSGRRTEFDFPIDPDGTDFQKAVWNVLIKIPYGQALSYGEVARLAGNGKACRAVGNAVGRNPVLIAIPCHRVKAANGLGGFSAGIEVKKFLIKKENITI